jgi:holo-[acyl-carrier protein] synthase
MDAPMIAGVGIDLVDIGRVVALLDRHPERARSRLFTPGERRYCDARAVPSRHYAARLAAKEAAFKALSGTEEARGIGWREIEVCTDDDGRPALLLHGGAARRAAELCVARVLLSLSHADAVAGAVVVLESGE